VMFKILGGKASTAAAPSVPAAPEAVNRPATN
jgi:hypothetical protein